MSNTAFWNDAAGSSPIEGGGEFPNLPAECWYSAVNASVENGQSQPTIKEFVLKDGSTGYKFNAGLIVDGGQQGVDPKFKGKYCFFNAFVTPNPEGADSGNLMSGRLTGFLNSMYASGVALDEKDKTKRAAQRWGMTIAALKSAAERFGLEPEGYATPGLFLAVVAAKDLAENPRRILFKSSARKYPGKDGTEKVSVDVGAYEDYTEEQAAKRKVVDFDAVLTGSTRPGF